MEIDRREEDKPFVTEPVEDPFRPAVPEPAPELPAPSPTPAPVEEPVKVPA